LPALLSDLIPVDVVIRPSWRSVAMGIGTGLWVALVFALLPLLGVRRVPLLAALRRDFEPTGAAREPARWLALLLLAGSIIVLAGMQAGDWLQGLAFSVAIAAAIVLLAAAAWLLIRLARRRLPPAVPYVWRQGVANLHRPANQTMMVVLAIGFGAFLLATLFLIQQNLLKELHASRGSDARPNFVLFDIQPRQHAAVDSLMRAGGREPGPPVPIVPMRILSRRGRPAAEIMADTMTADSTRGPQGWTLRREYRSTWRDSLTDSEQLIAGTWWRADSASPDTATLDPSGAVVDISIEEELSTDLGVGLGDEIVSDVQGVPLRSRARIEDPALRGTLQRAVAERFPNVTSIDLTLLQAAIEQLVERVSLAIRFMAVFSLATGVLVLIGAVATSRYQRVREGALLKTL